MRYICLAFLLSLASLDSLTIAGPPRRDYEQVAAPNLDRDQDGQSEFVCFGVIHFKDGSTIFIWDNCLIYFPPPFGGLQGGAQDGLQSGMQNYLHVHRDR